MNWLTDMTLAEFAWPWLLLAIPLPWLLHKFSAESALQEAALRVPWRERLQQVAQGRTGFSRGKKFPWLLWLAWCLLCVAAARPQQLGEPVAPPLAGRELMLALDLSASMAEEDMQLGGQPVDRLTAAKAVLADFLQHRAGDKIGLLVFADRAFALTPLTLDHQSVRLQLHDAVLGLVGRATALGDAIALATKRLQGQNAKQKVLIVLTDGVNTAGVVEPEKAAQIAKDAGVKIYTVAFGGDGSAVSVFGFRLPLGGGDDVDEAGLQRIAQMTGGQSFRARDTESLAKIYAEIDRLEPVRQQGQMIRPKIERYPLPLGGALGLLLLSVLLRRKAT